MFKKLKYWLALLYENEVDEQMEQVFWLVVGLLFVWGVILLTE